MKHLLTDYTVGNILYEVLTVRKLCLFHHTKRSSVGLAKSCLEGWKEGCRTRGRPKRCFMDDINAWSGLASQVHLNAAVLDRTFWRRHCNDATHSGLGGESDTPMKHALRVFHSLLLSLLLSNFLAKVALTFLPKLINFLAKVALTFLPRLL